MPTRAAEPHGVGAAAKEVAGHARRLAKLGLELAKLEVKSKATAIGLGIGALVVALFGVGFLLATIAVALAIVLDAWLALLVVTLGLFAVAGTLGLAARAKLRAGTAPERESSNGHR